MRVIMLLQTFCFVVWTASEMSVLYFTRIIETLWNKTVSGSERGTRECGEWLKDFFIITLNSDWSKSLWHLSVWKERTSNLTLNQINTQRNSSTFHLCLTTKLQFPFACYISRLNMENITKHPQEWYKFLLVNKKFSVQVQFPLSDMTFSGNIQFNVS